VKEEIMDGKKLCEELKEWLEDEIQWQNKVRIKGEKRRMQKALERHKRVVITRALVTLTAAIMVFSALSVSIYAVASVSKTEAEAEITACKAKKIAWAAITANNHVVPYAVNKGCETIAIAPVEEVNPYIISFTDEELALFEKIMAAESYWFWKESDVLSLATVVVNRVLSDEYPDNLRDVLTQENQFATYANGRYRDAVVTDECRAAVNAALRGERNLNMDVLWFCTKEYYNSPDVSNFFLNLEHVYTCRNVFFFEER